MIEKMTKVQLIGPKGLLDECIRTLHAMAVLHIENVPAGFAAEEAYLRRLPIEKEKLHEKEGLDKAHEMLKNMRQLLARPQAYMTVKVAASEIKKLAEELEPVGENVTELHARKDELTEELAVIGRYEKLLRGFAPIVPRLGGLKNFEMVGLTIEKTREDVTKLLDIEINRITEGSYNIFVEDLDETTRGVVLTFPKKFDSTIRQLLTGKSISEVRLPDEYGELTLIEALKQMERRKNEEIPWLMHEVDGELDAIARQWYWTITGLLKAIEDAVDEIGILTYAAQTRFTFVVEGWVPLDTFPEVKKKFNSIFKDKVLVRELEIKEKEVDLIPVYIRNPQVLRPFEVFLSALPPPKYGTVDPTPYIAIFFPAFFGLIVGDIGYGAIVFAVSLLLRRKLKEKAFLRDIATVLSVCSLSAIVFGFLFGELFGDLGERLHILHPILFDRIKALKTLMILTIGIGIGHVLLGIVLGAVNQIHRHRPKEAGAKITYFILIVSFLVIMAIMAGYLPRTLLTPGAIVFFFSFVVFVAIEGIIGPLEFIKALGNMLSYVRIMAVGTASVVMALVANKIGGLSENLIVGILAAGMIHLLNIVLSVLSPSIQSMRLQYVEFFSKFYEGGGRKYKPFKKR
jgi:V/A-type H+-transporting ATPase subunit I